MTYYQVPGGCGRGHLWQLCRREYIEQYIRPVHPLSQLKARLATRYLGWDVALRRAILSRVDPDGFASRGGYCAPSGDIARGLRTLLQDYAWRVQGERGFRYVHDHYHPDLAVERLMRLYERLPKT